MEYLLLIIEFFLSKKIRSYFSLIVIPLLISFVLYFSISDKIVAGEYFGNIINLLGILLGFTISLFAIFLSANNSNIREAKSKLTDFEIFNKKLTVFDVMQIGIAYVIIMECLLLVLNISLPMIITEPSSIKLFIVINIGLLSHVILILLRSVLDFYFALSKR